MPTIAMSRAGAGWIDVAIVVAFLVYSISSGFRNRSVASRSLEEYFLAGRSQPGWKAGISMAATQFAADTPLLVTGLIATSGIFALWQLWIYALAFLMMGFLLAPSWRRAGVITDAELTEVRYSSGPAAVLRGLKAFYFGTLFNCTVLAWVFFAAAKIAEPFLHWNVWLPADLFAAAEALVRSVGVPLTNSPVAAANVWIISTNNLISVLAIVAVTTLYSATGGLRSVIATDVVQFAIMMVGTLAFTIVVVHAAGGLGGLGDRVRATFANGGPGGIRAEEILAFTPSRAANASWTLLALFGLQWLIQLNADGTGYLAQRSMACKTEHEAKIAAVVFTAAQILARSFLWIPLGLGLLVLFPPHGGIPPELLQADREATYVRGMAELLPVGLKGLMLTGMLAALASTVDTHLNWGSSYWANDIYKRFVCQAWLEREPSERSLVWVARLGNVLILVIALAIMSQLDSIRQAWQTSLLLGAGMGVVLVLRWLWWRVNAWAEIAAIAASAVTAPILLVTVDDHALRLLVIALVSTAAALVAVAWRGPEDMDQLVAFYRRVRPPGFWEPVARVAGIRDDARARLTRALAATVTASLSMFCLLTGVGSLLADSPPPTWFAYRSAWLVLLLAVGVGLVPVWVRLGFTGPKATTAMSAQAPSC